MSSNAKHLPALHMRERSSSPRLRPGNSNVQAVKPHRRAISPSAAGEQAGMFTTRSPSPIGLSVLFGSQRTNTLRQSATRHRQTGRLSYGSRRTDLASRMNSPHLANSLETQKGASMQTPSEPAIGTASVLSSPSPSFTSLTGRSRWTPNVLLTWQGQAGAPYLGR